MINLKVESQLCIQVSSSWRCLRCNIFLSVVINYLLKIVSPLNWLLLFNLQLMSLPLHSLYRVSDLYLHRRSCGPCFVRLEDSMYMGPATQSCQWFHTVPLTYRWRCSVPPGCHCNCCGPTCLILWQLFSQLEIHVTMFSGSFLQTQVKTAKTVAMPSQVWSTLWAFSVSHRIRIYLWWRGDQWRSAVAAVWRSTGGPSLSPAPLLLSLPGENKLTQQQRLTRDMEPLNSPNNLPPTPTRLDCH